MYIGSLVLAILDKNKIFNNIQSRNQIGWLIVVSHLL